MVIMMMKVTILLLTLPLLISTTYATSSPSHQNDLAAMIVTPITKEKNKRALLFPSSLKPFFHRDTLSTSSWKQHHQRMILIRSSSSSSNSAADDIAATATATNSDSNTAESTSSESYYIDEINKLTLEDNKQQQTTTAAQQAEALLDEMERYYEPNGALYSKVSLSWSSHCKSCLEELTQLEHQFSIFPSSSTDDDSTDITIMDQKRQEQLKLRSLTHQYNECLEQIQFSAKKAWDILQRSELLLQEESSTEVKENLPSLEAYEQVINIWEAVLDILNDNKNRNNNAVVVKSYFEEKEGGGRNVVKDIKRRYREIELLLESTEKEEDAAIITKNEQGKDNDNLKTTRKKGSLDEKEEMFEQDKNSAHSQPSSTTAIKTKSNDQNAKLGNTLQQQTPTKSIQSKQDILSLVSDFSSSNHSKIRHLLEPSIQQALRDRFKGGTSSSLTTYNLNFLLAQLATIGTIESASCASDLLEFMVTSHAENSDDDNDNEAEDDNLLKPNSVSINTVLDAWANCAKSIGEESPNQIKSLLKQWKLWRALYKGVYDDVIVPDVVSYNTLIKAWGRSVLSRSFRSASVTTADILRPGREAERTLQRAQLKFDKTGIEEVKPDLVTYACVLDTWANCALRASMNGDVVAAKESLRRAEEMLGSMRRQRRGGATNAGSGGGIYNDSNDDLEYVEMMMDDTSFGQDSILEKQQQQQQQPKQQRKRNILTSSSIKPNTRCFNAVLKAYANSGLEGSGKRALRLLRAMEESRDEEEETEDGQSPDTRTYNIVLNALANSGDLFATQTAWDLVREMEEAAADDDDEEESTEGEVESGKKRRRKREIRPDTYTYNTVIDVLAKSGERNAAEKAEELLKRMEYLHKVENRDDVRPDKFTYTSVINAWAKSKEMGSARRAEKLVFDLIKSADDGDDDSIVKLDTSIYNALINCWAKSGEFGAEERAEEILKTMEKRYEMGKDENIRPNVRTYTSVIDAIANTNPKKKGAAKRALEILDYMESSYEKTRNKQIRPNIRTYTACITCWARSSEHGKAIVARDVLKRMEDQYYNKGNVGARPNIFAYNAVLNACGYTPTIFSDDSGNDDDDGIGVGEDDEDESFDSSSANAIQDEVEQAFRVACQTFDDIRRAKGLYPTHVTYGLFLGVCSHLMPKSDVRNDLVEKVFRRCCTDGQVGDLVLRRLKQAASPDLYDVLLQGRSEDDLPSKWTCNVRKRG